MHAAVALAWEFWGRHRWGLAGAAALVAGFAASTAAAPLAAQVAMASTIWFVMALSYVIGVFAYGFEARLEAAESGFPPRLFVLPVPTWLLVGWPMVQGVIVSVAMWLAWDGLVLRPAGVETPGWWVPMLAAVVACAQALVWLPFGVAWLRIVVMALALTALLRSGVYFDDPAVQERVLTGVAAGLVPAAFLVARSGVARARRGDNPEWAWLRRPAAGEKVAPAGRERAPFASAMAAQTWYEWRLRGRGYVAAVAAVVAVLAAVALLFEHESTRADFGLVFLFVPPLIAAYWGAAAGSPGDSIRSTALSTFAATRPLDNWSLVAAKVRALTLAAAATWLVVLAFTAGWIAAADGFERLARMWESSVERQGRATAVGFCALFAAGLVVGTWRALVANLWVGLTGRTWLVPLQTFVISLPAMYLFAEWVHGDSDPARRERLLAALPWIASAAVAVKLLAAGGFVYRDGASRFVGAWAVAAAGLAAALVWLVPPALVPAHGVVLGVVLFLPLARLTAAPRALAWNRHR
ncbi:MAG TPA: hypothetical protein VD866_19685 [Urbifossiella sp.]|nr:hypothetical protein [Urbifossiella sp.]